MCLFLKNNIFFKHFSCFFFFKSLKKFQKFKKVLKVSLLKIPAEFLVFSFSASRQALRRHDHFPRDFWMHDKRTDGVIFTVGAKRFRCEEACCSSQVSSTGVTVTSARICAPTSCSQVARPFSNGSVQPRRRPTCSSPLPADSTTLLSSTPRSVCLVLLER